MNDTVNPPCQDTTGPRSVVAPALLDQTLHLTPLAQRIQLALSLVGARLSRDLAATRNTTLALGYDLFGLDPNAPESVHRLAFYADLIVKHRDEVTGHVAPF